MHGIRRTYNYVHRKISYIFQSLGKMTLQFVKTTTKSLAQCTYSSVCKVVNACIVFMQMKGKSALHLFLNDKSRVCIEKKKYSHHHRTCLVQSSFITIVQDLFDFRSGILNPIWELEKTLAIGAMLPEFFSIPTVFKCSIVQNRGVILDLNLR